MTHVRTAALAAAALTLGVVIGLSLTASAGTTDTSCPPPSAQLAAAQPSPLGGTDCAEPPATTPAGDATYAAAAPAPAPAHAPGDELPTRTTAVS